ncbi:MAG: TolC family protein [Chitinophagales bacterium]|nr:TolC family protein [Chitinophagales bacterium]
MARFIAFFLLIPVFIAHAQEKWTLEQCLKHALENNLQIKQTRLNEEAARNQRTQAYADFLPSINGDLSYGVNFGRSIDPTTYEFVNQRIQTGSLSGTSGVTLFNGLNKINTLNQRKFDVLASQSTTEDVANTISLNITSSFLQILLNTEAQKTAEERLKLSSDQVEQTKKLVNAGVLPEGNLLDVLAQQATDTFTYIVSANGVELSKLSLAILLQLDDPAVFDVEIPAISMSAPAVLRENNAKSIYAIALGNQASVQSATYGVLSAKKSLSAMRGLYYPSLSFFYNLRTNHSSIARRITADVDQQNILIGYVDDGSFTPVRTIFTQPIYENAPFLGQYSDNLYHSLGFSLSVPLFNGLQTRTAVKNMELQAVKAEYNLKAVQDQLKSDVYVAYADAKAAYQKFLAAQNSVSALERSFEYVTKKFNLGAANTLEYSTASNNLLAVQSELIQSKYDYIFKLKVLDFYLGNPITLN